MITKQTVDNFILRHNLPENFSRLIDEHYHPLSHWLAERHPPQRVPVIGISGAQGTGKSTLAAFLKLALREDHKLRAAVLSIDDFYYTKAERLQLSETVHPLLITRGVPGTHDTQLLRACIDKIQNLGKNDKLSIPSFSKAHDERAPSKLWPVVTGPVDFVVLEGWCVGSVPQTNEELLRPVNKLELEHDPSGKWRGFVNRQLRNKYAAIFAELDNLLFLQAPDFETVFLWRLEQEQKLAARSGDDCGGIMNRDQLTYFMQHYERLTRANLASLPAISDVVLRLDDKHNCVERFQRNTTA